LNRKFEGILLASDLDGTLIDGNFQIPDKNIKAIDYFCKSGGMFAAATGRSPQAAREFLEKVKPNVPCVCLNGVVIYDFKKNEYLWECELDYSSVSYIKDILGKFPQIGIEVFSRKINFILNWNKQTRAHVNKEHTDYLFCKTEELCGKLHKVLFMGEKEDIRELEEYCKTLNCEKISFVASGDNFFEMLPKGVNKGTGLKKLAKILEIDEKNVYSVGDFYNDIPLIYQAGFGACVEEAPKEVKKISDIVLGKCENGAVSQLINIIEERQSIKTGGYFQMNSQKKKELALKACKVRQYVIEGTYNAKSGHPGGSLSATDILTYLYFAHMNVDPQNPKMPERDRFVLSKGHAAPALYGALATRGFFDIESIKTLRHADSVLQGHPDMKAIPGIDMSTGSLGQGISTAVGMAIDAKVKGRANRVFAVLGDGELQEGQVWEAAMLAGHKKLGNLVVAVDNNNLQIDGEVGTVVSPYPIGEKFAAFGWYVIEIDGHNFDEIEKAYQEADTVTDKPVVIVAKTVKGKGVSFMENKADWHGVAPNTEQYEAAMSELNAQYSALEAE